MLLPFFILSIFAATMLATIYKDATTMTIPNWISLLVIAGFFITMPFVWQGWSNFGEHLAVGGVMLMIGFVMFATNGLGGGDAKLMAAISLWWTWTDLTMFVIYTLLAGGALALFILVGRYFVPARIITSSWMHTIVKDNSKMPYGLALAAGALGTLPQSEIFKIAAGSL